MTANAPIAHSRNSRGQRDGLVRHLRGVAEQAAAFGAKFGAGEIARLAGLCHDLGKFHPDFQAYLYKCEIEEPKVKGPDHKAAGSLFLKDAWFVAAMVAGHHGGLQDHGEYKAWLADREQQRDREGEFRAKKALAIAREYLPELEAVRAKAVTEYGVQQASWGGISQRHRLEMLIRMVFSCLVDADFLDTEQHFAEWKTVARSSTPVASLWSPFAEYMRAKQAEAAPTVVNAVRRDVYKACVDAAMQPPGFFRLTVPTGGGKTLAGLGFGLKHAQANGLDRVIFAIPYTSICEQTTNVYTPIFGPGCVLENHSAVEIDDPDSPATARAAWGRLAAENWDAPVVVTTTVQLFESLLAASTSKCRKLHNLASAVIILDEAQTIPAHLLDPIIDVLNELRRAYGTTTVFCTATQPDLRDALDSQSLGEVTEIVPNYRSHFAKLERVHYARAPEPWSWARVAEEMEKSPQALAILNTRQAAQDVAKELLQRGILPKHLSTQMCGQHRREVLQCVIETLKAGESCHLVATQVVEAGVDLDFPLVLRAFGPLDRIVQAAGRCNRNGLLLERGHVIVFDPVENRLPPGNYRIATEVGRLLWDANVDPDDPDLFPKFFRRYFKRIDRDKRKLQGLREEWRFAQVARDARVIEDGTTSVLVPFGDFAERLADLRSQDMPPRLAWRRAQPYLVSLRMHELGKAQRSGLLEPIRDGVDLYLWKGVYDPVFGLLWESQEPSTMD